MPPARRCIKCGQAFCPRCNRQLEAKEYCSQCLHLFVLGDGLAPGTKSRKLYEVERHTRLLGRVRLLASLVLPGTAQLVRGKPLRGLLILALWFAALVAWQPGLLVGLERILGAEAPLWLLESRNVPTAFDGRAFGLLALLCLPFIWLAGNIWPSRRHEF